MYGVNQPRDNIDYWALLNQIINMVHGPGMSIYYKNGFPETYRGNKKGSGGPTFRYARNCMPLTNVEDRCLREDPVQAVQSTVTRHKNMRLHAEMSRRRF